jgi:hypothetical protein
LPWGLLVQATYLRAGLEMCNSSINKRRGCPSQANSSGFSFLVFRLFL